MTKSVTGRLELPDTSCVACGGGPLEAGQTKGDRVSIYVVCPECNAQTFLRSPKAIKAFTASYGDDWRTPPKKEPEHEHQPAPAKRAPATKRDPAAPASSGAGSGAAEPPRRKGSVDDDFWAK